MTKIVGQVSASVVQSQAAGITQGIINSISSDKFVFWAGLDGTNNIASDPAYSNDAQSTAIGALGKQISDAAANNTIARYYPGVGTPGTALGSSLMPMLQSEATARQVLADYAREANKWLKENLDKTGADLTLELATFSRGAIPGAMVTQLLMQEGLVHEGVVLIPPGQARIAAALVISPVLTGSGGSNLAFVGVENQTTVYAGNDDRVAYTQANYSNDHEVWMNGTHGDVGSFYDKGIGGIALKEYTDYFNAIRLGMVSPVLPSRQYDGSPMLDIHAEPFSPFTLWNLPNGSSYADGTMVETMSVGQLPVTSGNITTFVNFKGELVTMTRENGVVQSVVVSSNALADLTAGLATMTDILSLVKAIQTGQPLPIVASGLRVAVDYQKLTNHGNVDINLAAASDIAGGILSLMSLNDALKRNDALGIVTSTVNLVNFTNLALLRLGKDLSSPALNAFLNGGRAAATAADTAANAAANAAGGAAEGTGSVVAEAVPFLAALNLVQSVKNKDPIGASLAFLSIVHSPVGVPLALAYSVFRMVGSLFGSDDEIIYIPAPIMWGEAHYAWQNGIMVPISLGNGGGENQVVSALANLTNELQAMIVNYNRSNSDFQVGLVAQRLPALTWREGRLDEPGNHAGWKLTDIDLLTGLERQPNLRYDDAGRSYNAEANSREQYWNMAQRFINVALERGAIAAKWEVDTAIIQDAMGMAKAGLAEEEWAAKAGFLAPALAPQATSQVFRPITLDLDGSGRIERGVEVAFNADDSGYLKRTDWITPQDGFLFLDRNMNGRVDGGREIFSNALVGDGMRGLNALEWTDADGNGVIDRNDPVFNQLRVWRDSNGNGVEDTTLIGGASISHPEVKTLAELGITSLNYRMATFTHNGLNQAMLSQGMTSDTAGTRVAVVSDGLKIFNSDGTTSLIVTQVGDNTLLEPMADRINGIEEDVALRVPVTLLLANDRLGGVSGNGLALDVMAFGGRGVGNASHGTVSVDTNGYVLFTPDRNYNGSAGFSYGVLAPNGQTAIASVSFNIAAINDDPVAWVEFGDGSAVDEDEDGITGQLPPSTGRIRYYDIDDPIASLQVRIAGLAQMGNVSLGTTSIDPASGFGSIAFAYINRDYKNREGISGDRTSRQDDPFRVRISDPHAPTNDGYDGANTTDGRLEIAVGTQHVGSYDPGIYVPPPIQSGGGGGKKPITIDLDRNGFQFTNVDDSDVFFEVNNDGWRHRVSWTRGGDAFLAYDENGDGRIDHGAEISFSQYLMGAQSDMEGLRTFDSNGDGLLSAKDEKWTRFGVWADANSNGVNEAGEFRSLPEMGIKSVRLSTDGLTRVIDGQTVHGVGKVTMEDGSTRDLADVRLRYTDEILISNTSGGQTRILKALYSADGAQIDDGGLSNLLLGEAGNNTGQGSEEADAIIEDVGDDYIDGKAGDDWLFGGADNDTILGGSGNDKIFGGTGNDLAVGGTGADVIMLDAGNDIGFGGAGNDVISGGVGNDVLAGNDGDDQLFGEIGDDFLSGDTGADELFGLDGNDYLDGGADDDLLDGGLGADLLVGGAGNDTYVVDNAADVITENDSESTDTVQASVGYALTANVENLTLTGSTAINGSGNALDNVITGNAANNILNGQVGVDTMIGGIGHDSYFVDNVSDIVTEKVNEGIDSVTSSVSYTLGANVENLTLNGIESYKQITAYDYNSPIYDWYYDDYREEDSYGIVGYSSYVLTALFATNGTGTAAINGTGNELNNVIYGNSGNNVLDGGLGNDYLSGGAGNDTLNGQGGADTMVGGTGNDSYYVDSVSDIVNENGNEGTDSVTSSVNYTLGANVENLTVTGVESYKQITVYDYNSPIYDWYFDDEEWEDVRYIVGYSSYVQTVISTADGTGNALNNVITGSEAKNTLTGGAGNDTLNGQGGADTMIGGAGNDSYFVDNVSDIVTEKVNEGIDSITSSVSYTLGANVENLTLTGSAVINGTGNILNNILVGNWSANVLDGGVGNDTLDGGGGVDTLMGGAGDDTYNFFVGGGVNTIVDISGTDQLVFGAGILASGVMASRTGSQVKLAVSATDSVSFAETAPGQYAIETVSFVGGAVWQASDIRQMVNAAPTLVNAAPSGTVTVSGTATQNQTLTAANTLADLDGLGSIGYQWQSSTDGTTWSNISGATASSLMLAEAQVGKQVRINASYTDGYGTAESKVSVATAAIANVNDAPTGAVTVSGTATQNQTLTAANTLADLDGMGNIGYQWQSSTDGTTWSNISGATASSLTLAEAQVGRQIRAVASYTDGHGTVESKVSAATAAIANVNDAPTGTVTVSGVATQNQTITAANTLADLDGMGGIGYQWQSSLDGTTWSNISGATASSLTLAEAQVGKQVRVNASYTDGHGTAESKVSTATAVITNVNDAPAGAVTVSGTATQNQMLTAANTLADLDGLGSIGYQWQSSIDGTTWSNISGATASSLTLAEAQVGKQIRAVASYTDGHGTAESKVSAATAAILANVNAASTGTVTMSGVAIQNQILTAANTLADLDGLGIIGYQWQSSSDGTTWSNISGATASSLTLAEAQVGKQIRAVASYTDGHGTAESKVSVATAAIANVNDAPTGTVTVSGVATQNQTITAVNTLADLDGLGSIGYQWQSSSDGTTWSNISGTTASSLTLTEAQVGKQVRAVASYTDGHGTAESKVSVATAAIANVNDAPTGTVTVSGTATQNQTLTVANTLADLDGMGGIGYQWQSSTDGTTWSNISGATASSLTLAEAQVGKQVRVNASYTDGHGTAESKVSTATAVIANVNDAPAGAVTVSGTATQNQTLTAVNTLADVDGLGSIGYQWQSSIDGTTWSNISGATASSLTLAEAQVGKQIRVNASYTDGHGTAESKVSAATAAIANVNDAPTGTITVSGTATQNQILTVANTLADLDGLASIGYLWQSSTDGTTWSNISGATASSLTLTEAQVGKQIRVSASYTDGHGTAESKTSAATVAIAAIANVNNYIVGTAAADDLVGTAFRDVIEGLGGNDCLTGGADNDNLTGGADNDILNGQAGVDTMIGGTGHDSYFVDNVSDIVTEKVNEGIDSVTSSVSYTLGANVENLTLNGIESYKQITAYDYNSPIYDWYYDDYREEDSYGIVGYSSYVQTALFATNGTGTAAINGTGNELNNVIYGNSGNNVLDGGLGNDYFSGGAGNDTLNGQGGADTMIGGAGNDSYYVDSASDIVTENVNEGTDSVTSSVNYTLGANVENLTVTGVESYKQTTVYDYNSPIYDWYFDEEEWADFYGIVGYSSYVQTIISTADGTGNALNNAITGSEAKNTLTGGAGNDTLNGQGGADTMIGGAGNDTYSFSLGAGIDTINNNDATGFDTVAFGAGIGKASVGLFRNGNNLEIGYSSLDKVSVSNFFSSANYQVDEVELADGSNLTAADINRIVQDMAAYSVNEGIALGSVNDVRNNEHLMSIIANYWHA